MKYLVLIICLFTYAVGSAQKVKFDNADFGLELTIERTLDSIRITFNLLNKTDRSFYFQTKSSASVNWSKTGELLIVDLGSDLKRFTEFEFPVTQLKAKQIYNTRVNTVLKKENFNLKLGINFYRANENKSITLLNTNVRSTSGDWIWSEYFFPFSVLSKK